MNNREHVLDNIFRIDGHLDRLLDLAQGGGEFGDHSSDDTRGLCKIAVSNSPVDSLQQRACVGERCLDLGERTSDVMNIDGVNINCKFSDAGVDRIGVSGT